ncbi:MULTISPECIES: ABC transporter permease [unclassified Crossiella]|uniref:ABC transporter permease n=1 Tax=unclassified Crossiella TaxID=2620835 RepID=UPI001FFFA329|nr:MULTISPECIES: ABC transporter permease [unclassified Crossiella]MCK2239650.1 ABC transporter permease [Crossiella sp. S99.2]MCK2252345.1 ABC transporter permease [Crossiella sp. S99.1]
MSGAGPVRLSLTDTLRLGLLGIRTRRLRAALSALGIAIGIATTVIVTGVPASSHQALLDELSALGTNLLRAEPASNQDPPVLLPDNAAALAARIGPVTGSAAVANTHAVIRRSDRADPSDGAGITVLATTPDLLSTVHGSVHSGRFLDAVGAKFPTVVLGNRAAARLGITEVHPGEPAPQLYLGQTWFSVTGVLADLPLHPDLERSVFVGTQAAREHLGFDGHPTVVYVTAREDAMEDVRAVLPATLYPRLPGLVRVGKPSDALAAKRATQNNFAGLFLGLAGIALLVGGIGVANTMFISVLERRREIGLRRALGATRGQIRGQFLTEAVALSGLGGLAGALIGVLGTLGYVAYQDWPPVIPPLSVAGGVLGAVIVGMAAGIHPAARAARLSPTQALAAA